MRQLFSKLLISAVLFSLASSIVVAQPSGDDVHEIVITGKVPGPPMWEIRNGENTLWIFGVLSPLPKDLIWDSAQVERVIQQAGAIIRRPEIEPAEDIGIGKGITLLRHYWRMRKNMPGDSLEEVLPGDVYEKLLVARDAYGPRGNGLFKLRPLLAAVEISRSAIDSADLVQPRSVTRKLDRLIKRSDAEILQSSTQFTTPVRDLLLEVDTMPFHDEVACLDGALDLIAEQLQYRREIAVAWAYGYMGELYLLRDPPALDDCIEGLLSGPNIREVAELSSTLWLEDAERALQGYTTSFAVLSMDEILGRQSLINALAEKGYEVIEP